MFAKESTNRSKKDKASISTARDSSKALRASIGGVGFLWRRRESSATPGRASSAERIINLNDNLNSGRFRTIFQLLMILGIILQENTYV